MTSGSSEAEKQAELRRKIEYKVACEERAHKIVERLIDNPISQDTLLNAVQLITPSHYEDITVERAIAKLCGYPLCQNNLEKILKQRYIISTKTNTVYDIETRKNFCSSQCLKASHHLEKQISSDPVWSRKNLPPRKIQLLPIDLKCGKLGDEVLVSKHVSDLKHEVTSLEKQDEYLKNLHEMIKKSNKTGDEAGKDETKADSQRGSVNTEKARGNISTDEPCVYTLDKAMSDLGMTDGGEGALHEKDDTIAESDKDSQDNFRTEAKEADSEEDFQRTDKHSQNERPSETCTKVDQSSNVKVPNVEKETKLDNKQPEPSVSKPNKKDKKAATKAKTDYLMQLLDKRKSLLSKMVDIQDTSEDVVKPGEEMKENAELSDKKLEYLGDTVEPKVMERSTASQGVHVREIQTVHVKHGAQSTDSKKSNGVCPKKQVSTLKLICETLRSWISQDTVEFLNTGQAETGSGDSRSDSASMGKKSDMERQYDALVAKVDAQEAEFDNLLGEESLEEVAPPSGPLPHYEVLKEEIEENQYRVQKFLKGAFTYKIQERQVLEKDSNDGVALPTLDRYDQLLIRRRIVLDRISKVLPSLLSPLDLIQDVYTHFRELVFTFRLTSENIIFKPAEWTLVALIMLKLLSKKIPSLEQAFRSPSSEKYFNLLLSSLREDMTTLQSHVDSVIPTLKRR
ncbi:putative RNA polymerase II subunit B1 CTD phosphatase RPAP2 [Mya arenaria]|uniref:putative RNA polymerase II subunit B1 CTD phosphatase RPAP2 n=1 Tax=Mya arenaria TaxID=6604 RepID=UPI0022E43510|nr:putative RNA polymerase II subunit B1 CTD phosphatase RPAP2 [Mya arenaria]